MVEVKHLDGRLTPDPARVVIRPFHIAPEPRDMHPVQAGRARRIVDEVLAMTEAECRRVFAAVDADFDDRHWQTEDVYVRRCAQVLDDLGIHAKVSQVRRELIGAYFCHEYSYAAAAIMNPSIVPHPNQAGLGAGDQRFVMSLRTVGEGHISSIAFREGILGQDGSLSLWPSPPLSMAVEAAEPRQEGVVIAQRSSTTAISGTVIFPFTRQQRNGLEDLRLVQFTEENGAKTYYGTYTAYSGSGIASEMLETPDFDTFKFSPMSGEASKNKGMGLFPKRIGGAYAMIGRQDGESLFYMRSDDLLRWDGGEKVLAPKYPWELVQIGNCGAPIELDEGWLILTHGVGAMRKYAIGAALLDKNDPSKVLGRLAQPLISPSDENREGYVPNVCYTCGGLKHGGQLFLPYAVADSSVLFAMIDLRSLLAAME